jgi:hypothetical protein
LKQSSSPSALWRRRSQAALLAPLIAFAPFPAGAQPSDAAYALVSKLAAAMKRCWFMGGDPMFGDYVAAPEPNATGGPRILVVQRNTPDGRPVLVIEILGGGAKPKVNVYGPLATGAAGERIGRDLRRWLDGGDGCG